MKTQSVSRPSVKFFAALMVLFAGLMLQATSAYAVGLGGIELKSALNEPLLAEVKLTGVKELSEDQMVVAIGTAEDFKRVGASRDFLYTKLKFAIVKDSASTAIVKITSADVMSEPSLNFVLRLQWPDGSVTREYTLLLATPK